MNKALRAQFITISFVIFIGIYMTGFDKAHWFLYAPVLGLMVAGLTGKCPGLTFWNKCGLK